MVRRQKWEQSEDTELKALLMGKSYRPDWELVAAEMNSKGFDRNTNQCRNR